MVNLINTHRLAIPRGIREILFSVEKNQRSDEFAGIAARGSGATGKKEMEAQNPPELSDRWVAEPTPGNASAFTPRLLATPESLRNELARARDAAAEFLQDLSPPQPEIRPTIKIAQADWRLEPSERWQLVSLPHYGGPMGKARSWYRAKVTLEESHFGLGALWVCFGGVDYKAAVFFNGELVGTHEGFFSPFEFEVTKSARRGENELLIRVDNDAICMGNSSWGDPRQGDKIYGATGLGWDEPGLGWHHCPPGMGIHRPVRIESRPQLHLHDLFARPLTDEEAIELWVEVFNGTEEPRAVDLEIAIHSQNFSQPSQILRPELPPADAGLNQFRVHVPMPAARRWSPATPWLYRASVSLRVGEAVDCQSRQFGLRTFQLDETLGPDGRRGRFFLNGQMIRLRGANTMGHEQQCVLRGDMAQLVDDILLAKLANLNFLRFTQRPVEPEVYDLCDRLGLMSQTDLPLFAYLRRNQFCEAVRQASEMERLTRGHASCVLASLINEPFPAAWGDKSHRHLTRPELERFFEAASHAIWIENPDRQIKPIDGDYDPPGPGLPDGHCYAGWYNGHGLDLGKLHRGFWLPVLHGWNYACGEFGAEGLEDEDFMRATYPPEWLESAHQPWSPSQIFRAQTGSHYHLWMEPGSSMSEWVRRSQAHQVWVTRLMTEAFRRNNHMVSFAIHLLIDAWPAGWMKTLMDCRRHPKPAYFTFREALAPLAVQLRLDRTTYFSEERLEAEVWLCNDTNAAEENLVLAYQLETNDDVLLSGRTPASTRSGEAVFQGRLGCPLPIVASRQTAQLHLGLLDASGRVVHDTRVEITLFPKMNPGLALAGKALGGSKAKSLADVLNLANGSDVILCDDPKDLAQVHAMAAEGGTALLLEFPPGEYSIAGSLVRFEETGMESRHFVARDPQHPVAQSFQENDFRFWLDPALDRPAPLLNTLFLADETWRAILHTGQGGWGRSWEPALAAAEKPWGKGKIIVCQVTLAGRLINPVTASFLSRLILSKPSDFACSE